MQNTDWKTSQTDPNTHYRKIGDSIEVVHSDPVTASDHLNKVLKELGLIIDVKKMPVEKNTVIGTAGESVTVPVKAKPAK